MTFFYEEKLKDLKVELKDDVYTIQYKDEKVTLCIENNRPKEATLVYKDDSGTISLGSAHSFTLGDDNIRRWVYHFAKPDGILPVLRCGYTSHLGNSTWSSTPHPFEREPVSGFEEVFLYLLSGGGDYKTSRAIQCGTGTWEDGNSVDETWRVFDRDISAIPMGYHPVVGEPGVHVSYIWAYLAKKKSWEKLP